MIDFFVAVNYRLFDGDFETVVFITGALGSGLMAGLYLTFTVSVLRALRKLPAPGGIAAMQSINREILNPYFFLVFFGTLAVGLAATLAAISSWPSRADQWAIMGTICYVVSFLITIIFNVPLNNRLDRINAHGGESDLVWDEFVKKWGMWNTVRFYWTLASAAGFLLAVYFHLEVYEWIEPD